MSSIRFAWHWYLALYVRELAPALVETQTVEASRLMGSAFPLTVLWTAQLGQTAHNDLLAFFGGGELHENATLLQWLARHGVKIEEDVRAEDLEGYDQFIQHVKASCPRELLELKFANMPPEKVLARLRTEERLAGLQPEERETLLKLLLKQKKSKK